MWLLPDTEKALIREGRGMAIDYMQRHAGISSQELLGRYYSGSIPPPKEIDALLEKYDLPQHWEWMKQIIDYGFCDETGIDDLIFGTDPDDRGE